VHAERSGPLVGPLIIEKGAGRSRRRYSLEAPPFWDSNPARPTSTSIEASPNFRRARTAAARLGIRRMNRQSSIFLNSCGVSIIWSRCPRVIGGGLLAGVNERPHLGFLCDCEARNTRSYRGLNQCRQPRLATLAGVTSLAAAISLTAERNPTAQSAVGFLMKKPRQAREVARASILPLSVAPRAGSRGGRDAPIKLAPS
jgi:hypothetical protein